MLFIRPEVINSAFFMNFDLKIAAAIIFCHVTEFSHQCYCASDIGKLITYAFL